MAVKKTEVSETPAKNSDRSERSVDEFRSVSRSIALPYSATLQDCRVDVVEAEMVDSFFEASVTDAVCQKQRMRPP